MHYGFWIAYWVLMVFFAMAKNTAVFSVQAIVFLLLMRSRHNEMSQNCWYGFWFSVLQAGKLLSSQVFDAQAVRFLIFVSTVARLCITSEYQMPVPAFWVFLIILVIYTGGRGNGVIVWYTVIIFNSYLDKDGFHLPGLLISHYITAAILLTTATIQNLRSYPGCWSTIIIWFASVGVLHNQMWPWNEDFGWLWLGAWWLERQAIVACFTTSMPYPWYAICTVLVVGLGFAFHPEKSLAAFTLWATSILVIRYMLFMVYLLYILGKGMRYRLFPFSLFSHKWRASAPRWFPLGSRNADSLNGTSLCERCNFVNNSKLIMGSSSFITRLIEWHKFCTRDEFVSKFQTSEPPDCHLCGLLWHSMSPQRQRSITEGVRFSTPESSRLAEPHERNAELRIKVWEERPLSLYTYMQLFSGDTAIGARLLAHRGNVFSASSPTTLHRTTNSFEHFEQAKKWLSACKDNHNLCQGVGNNKYKLPTRLLYVRGTAGWQPGDAPETLRLVLTSDVDASLSREYLALSHCWGPSADMRFKLLASNIDSCYKGIEFARLSRNMQDAITTTIRLGFSYIWIDSLCIIQKDDSGQEPGDLAKLWKDDWASEARKMGDVYSGAACTIASTGSPTSAGGCFHSRDVASLQPCKIGVSSPDALSPTWIYARHDDIFEFARNVDLAPLNTRGWVMQERLLSRRILHFGANMLYWECCRRSASELNPHGYTYKTFPEDFTDNYTPDLTGEIKSRADLRLLELNGRGISWATEEDVLRRPPAVAIDLDASPGSQEVWQHKRGFWRNALRPNDEPWNADEKGEDAKSVRAGYRAAFELLRGGDDIVKNDKDHQVGRYSFSQTWYDVVEPYSRAKLTFPTDKLVALKGIEDEVARATKFTYLYGLWKERLVTDLLWFAIEGPGKRLTRDDGVHVAPTWSWASIEGAVALDLLPENSLREIEDFEILATIHETSPSTHDPAKTTITLSGPVLSIEPPVFDGDIWSIDIGKTGNPTARVFPDVASPKICDILGLVCISFIVLIRDKDGVLVPASSEDVQGLVLRPQNSSECEGAVESYERMGYFTTSYVKKTQAASRGRKKLKGAEVKKLILVG